MGSVIYPETPMTDSVHVFPPAPRFVGATDAAKMIGISRSGFHNFVNRGVLPQPVRLGKRSLWEVTALVDALKSKAVRSSADTAPGVVA